jgi:serine protease AprX
MGHDSSSPEDARARASAWICPVCRREAEELLRGPLPEEQSQLVAANVPSWGSDRPLCRDCLDRFVSGYELLKARFPDFGQAGRAILPLATRLGANDEYTGRGVVVAFLDSGFFAHPDLDRDRILAYVDITNPRARRRDLERGDESSWHGMMTSVVACWSTRFS